ncbi:hypothetical protein TWF694_005296 [Orbilia ellipsospora]|uniref:Secreted protein n=1 Tax=Orbilia ellipsospora TaxID=2528407 RepID=A0AAV9WSU9_9PEZI
MGLFTSVALALTLAASSLASPVIKSRGTDFLPYPVMPMHFTGSVVPGGPVLDLNGTVQEILPEIIRHNPGWTPPKRKSPHAPGLVKKYFHGDPICNIVGADPAQVKELEDEVIPYLWGLGTGNCAWGSAVWLCNSYYREVHVSCTRIGDAAQHIVDWCEVPDGPFYYSAMGVWLDTTNYNVMVTASDC